MKKVVFIFTFAVFANWSCTKEEVCKSLEICDLASKIVVPAGQILIGVDLSIINDVSNLVASQVQCTEDAAESTSDLDLYFRQDANSSWQLVSATSDKRLTIPKLAPNTNKQHEAVYNFNQSGQYQWRTAADFDLKVAERDEANNNASAGGRIDPSGENNVAFSPIITVEVNPNIPIDPSKPPVTIKYIREIN